MIMRDDFPAGDDGLKEYQKAWRKETNYNSLKAKKWREEHPEQYKENQRRANLMRTHGITEVEYAEMLEAQNGVCACCKDPNYNKRLAVDHDHATGKRRGLLCHTCNNHLGIYEAKREMFDDYLNRNG